jgi:hypothetical protein
MRRGVDYAERAEECRRLAKSCQRPEDWGHLLEMAETWQMLLKHQQERSRWQTIALAERFRNVLFLSDIAAKGAAEENGNEKAA